MAYRRTQVLEGLKILKRAKISYIYVSHEGKHLQTDLSERK